MARNDGDGRFAAPIQVSSEPVGGSIARVVDLDIDGDNDIVWSTHSAGPIVQLNQRR